MSNNDHLEMEQISPNNQSRENNRNMKYQNRWTGNDHDRDRDHNQDHDDDGNHDDHDVNSEIDRGLIA
jgi:hypothetical protein